MNMKTSSSRVFIILQKETMEKTKLQMEYPPNPIKSRSDETANIGAE